jgi:hypothetical protein
MKTLVLLAALSVSVLGVSTGAAPELAVIKGKVQDSGGHTLPGVLILVINQQTKISHSTTTEEAGHFLVRNLEAGEYRVEAAMPGYARFARDDVRLAAGTVLALDIKLDLQEMPSHLGKAGKKFSMTIERVATSEMEKELIEKAEHIPCPEGKWWTDRSDEPRLPVCLNAQALDYYQGVIESYRTRRRTPSSFGKQHGPKILSAEGFYKATAGFNADSGQWVVELRLEYSQSCGNICGLVFLKTRLVIFDRHKNVIKVVGDGEKPHYSVS